MSRMTAFQFTLQPTAEQETLFKVAGGAARLTYNVLLGQVIDALDSREWDPTVKVPWTNFDLIKAINSWKRAELVGRGLDWHKQIPTLAFEEAAVDLSRALADFSASREGRLLGPKRNFPVFKTKNSSPYSFRVRNQNGCLLIGTDSGPRTIKLPKIGIIKVREDTRRLRRMLRPGVDVSGDRTPPRAVITSVTVKQHRGRWIASFRVTADDFHSDRRHAPRSKGDLSGSVGVDLGLIDLVVAATDDGQEVVRVEASKIFQRRQDGLARHQRALARKKRGSKRRREAVRKVAAYEGTTAAIRRHKLHEVTNQLVKNHDLLVIENLNVLGMVANHKLAKALADASFGTIARMLAYKAGWYGVTLLSADRFYPSSKTCSGCGARKKKLALSERLFCCDECGLRIDRDLNSAINLARLVAVLLERPGRGSSPGSGPVSGRPDDQCATQAPKRHRQSKITAVA